ncbi:MAG: FAD-dependent oxidoreductase [Thermodesulfobacteriota bacterium]
MARHVLVIGGGVAGVSAALELARAGVAVTLIEKDDFLGGHAASLACKAADACLKCNACLAAPRLEAALQAPGLTILRRAELVGLERAGRGFRARVGQRPAYIDPARCDGCGVCVELCPAAAEGALRAPRAPGDRPLMAIDPARCLHFMDGRSSLCSEACPQAAIDFGAVGVERGLDVDAVVLASGFAPCPGGEQERLGHGRVPGVLTALELEEMVKRRGMAVRPDDGAPARRIAFIQCVGSRQRLGRNYCSRVCCGYALRLGRALKARQGAAVTVFYMDLQSYGHDPDGFLAAAGEELELVRALPYDVWEGPGGGVRLEYQAQSGQAPQARDFDLVALSVGMAAGADNPRLAAALGLDLDAFGFLAGGDGVFTAGAALGPMDVAEAVASAGRAALRTLQYLEAAA